MKDNRIVRPDLLTEERKEVLSCAIDSFYNKHYKDSEAGEKAEREYIEALKKAQEAKIV